MKDQCDILQPKQSKEVCSHLSKYKGQTVLHAGGTDVLVRLRAGNLSPKYIVDLSKIASLKKTHTAPDKSLVIGSMVSLSHILNIEGFKSDFQGLYEAIQSIGSLQIRNRGTLVGNICNASPAADSVPALILYQARVNIRGRKGCRTQSVESFITGPGTIALALDEFVESVILPKPAKIHSSAYLKIGRRKAVDCSIASAAVRLDKKGRVSVAFGAVAERPLRAKKTEQYLSAKKWDDSAVEQAAQIATAEMSPIDDIRATKAYRQAMVGVLFKRAFNLARKRLENKADACGEIHS